MNHTIFDTIKSYTARAPVDVYKLCEALGIKVLEVDESDDDFSGSIEKRAGRYIIRVNKRHSHKRKRFTIAHELGHFVFHGDLINSNNGIRDDRLYRDARITSRNETQANKFAASILMPDQLINRLLDRGVTEASDLAQELEVSEQAMSIRLESFRPSEMAHYG